MQDFKQLKVWEKSHHFTLGVYKITQAFPKVEQYGLVSQMTRAAVSIPANIAEGCGKFTDNDKCRMFQIALGSVHESEYYLILTKDLKLINEAEYKVLNDNLNQVKAMLIVLIKRSKERINL